MLNVLPVGPGHVAGATMESRISIHVAAQTINKYGFEGQRLYPISITTTPLPTILML